MFDNVNPETNDERDFQLEVTDSDGTLLEAGRCPFCDGMHGYQVLSDLAPNIAFVNPYDQAVEVCVVYGEQELERFNLFPGESTTISSEQLETVTPALGEDGFVGVQFDIGFFSEVDEVQLTELQTRFQDATAPFLQFAGLESAEEIVPEIGDIIAEIARHSPLHVVHFSAFNEEMRLAAKAARRHQQRSAERSGSIFGDVGGRNGVVEMFVLNGEPVDFGDLPSELQRLFSDGTGPSPAEQESSQPRSFLGDLFNRRNRPT